MSEPSGPRSVLALDAADPEAVAALRARGSVVRVIPAAVLAHEPDASADAVLAGDWLATLGEPGPWLAEFRRVLRPGGIVLAGTPEPVASEPTAPAAPPRSERAWRAKLADAHRLLAEREAEHHAAYRDLLTRYEAAVAECRELRERLDAPPSTNGWRAILRRLVSRWMPL